MVQYWRMPSAGPVTWHAVKLLHSTCTLPALYLHSTCTQVQVGASLEARDEQGMTPLDLASDARVRQALLAVTRNTQAEGGKAEL